MGDDVEEGADEEQKGVIKVLVLICVAQVDYEVDDVEYDANEDDQAR